MWNAVGAGLDTIAAADAPLLVDEYESIIGLGDSPGRADIQATGFLAVHAGEACENPFNLPVLFQFSKLYLIPGRW
jgi:hypothetical protein